MTPPSEINPIPMVNIIRQFQKPLMVTITILVIISFIVLFNKTTVDRSYGGGAVALMYGKPVSANQLQRGENLAQLAVDLEAGELGVGLVGQQFYYAIVFHQLPSEAARAFAFADMVLRHEADRMGIQATQKEIEEAVQKIRPFLTSGAFDSSKYNAFITNRLGPLGFNGTQIDEIVGDQIRLQKLQQLVGGSFQPTAAAVRKHYEDSFQKTDASVVKFKVDDLKAGIQVSDDDLKKLFDSKKDTLKTPEKRKVKLVTFVLDETKPPTDRTKAIQDVQDRAENFLAATQEKNANIDELAAKFQGTVQDVPEFAQASAPTEISKYQQAVEKAFALTKEEPNSELVAASPNIGYCFVQLTDIVPGRPLTFDEAKEQLTEQIKSERSKEAMDLKVADVQKKIEADVKAGKSFADAAQAAGVKAETIPPFSANDQRRRADPDFQDILQAAEDMKEGDLSQKLIEANYGGFLLHIDKREPIDEADFEKKKAELTTELQQQRGYQLFAQWMDAQRKEAKIQTASGKDAD